MVNNFSYRTIDGIKVYALYKADNDDRIEIVRKLKSQNGDSEFTRDSANILFNSLKEYDGKISKNIIVVMPHSSSDLIRDWAKKLFEIFKDEANRHSGSIHILYDTFYKNDGNLYSLNADNAKDIKDETTLEKIKKHIHDANDKKLPVKSLYKPYGRFINLELKGNERYFYNTDSDGTDIISVYDLQHSTAVLIDDVISEGVTMKSCINALQKHYNVDKNNIRAYTLFNTR